VTGVHAWIAGREMAKGGKRPGAGRPKTKPQSKVRRDVAFDVLDEINKGKTQLNPSGRREIERWIEHLDSTNEDISLRALRALKDSADGKPMQPIGGADDQPLRINVNIRRVGA